MWCTQDIKSHCVHKPKEPNWSTGYAITEDGTKVYDMDVAKFVLQHTRFIDRFNPKKLIIAAIYALPMLLGDFKIPEGKNWKFFDKEFEKTWNSK